MQRLTTDPGTDSDPVWSPDGKSIAFVRRSENEEGIFMMPATSGERQEIQLSAARWSHPRYTRLSWAGEHLAFSHIERAGDPQRLYLLSVETLEKQPLTSPPWQWEGDYAPAFSPDGKTLAFVRARSFQVEDLYLVPAGGGEARRLTFDQVRIDGLAWTTDGHEIVFCSNRAGGPSFWRVRVTSGTLERLAIGAEKVSGIAIAPRAR